MSKDITAVLKRDLVSSRFGVIFPQGVDLKFYPSLGCVGHPKDDNLLIRVGKKDIVGIFSKLSHDCGCEYTAEWEYPTGGSLTTIKKVEVDIFCEEHDPTIEPEDDDDEEWEDEDEE